MDLPIADETVISAHFHEDDCRCLQLLVCSPQHLLHGRRDRMGCNAGDAAHVFSMPALAREHIRRAESLRNFVVGYAMLLKVLKASAQGLVSGRTAATSAAIEYPLETERKWNRLHERAPVSQHLDILFQNARFGNESFVELYYRCLLRTGTAVTPFNLFQRFQTRLSLVQYLLATLTVPGARAECGAYRGATAL